MAKRPSLKDMAKPKNQAKPLAEPQQETVSEPVAKKASAQPDGRKGILVRVSPEGWRQLRDLAAELTLETGETTTMQTLLVESINRTLKEHGRPPVA